MPVVSNSGPILSFARANRLDLLRQVLDEVLIPVAVYDDIAVQGAGRPGARAVLDATWIKRREVRNRAFADQLPHKLHVGEREALALARELDAALLIDEREARKEAQRLGIHHFGSLRILKEAKDRGFINEVKPVLDELIAAGTYLNRALYQEFLRQSGE